MYRVYACAKITNGEYPNNLHIHYDRAIST